MGKMGIKEPFPESVTGLNEIIHSRSLEWGPVHYKHSGNVTCCHRYHHPLRLWIQFNHISGKTEAQKHQETLKPLDYLIHKLKFSSVC